jgi:nucleotide-binding universal stress UspA family protein
VVVKGGTAGRDWKPGKILVPTNGSQPSREAAELAFRIASQDELVIVLTVVRTVEDDALYGRGDTSEERQFHAANQIVAELRDMGEAHGVRTLAMVRAGREPDQIILEVAQESSAGLVVLGTDVRPGSERLFLGPRVERILELARCPVIVYNAPSGPLTRSES